MTPSELAELLERLIESSDAAYVKSLESVQVRLYDRLLVAFKDLDLDAAGNIKQTAVNRRILLEADQAVQAAFRSPAYVNAVSAYISSIPEIDSLVGNYFESVSGSFKPNRAFLKDLQYDTIKSVEKYILQDGLEAQVLQPLSQMMSQNVNTGGSYSGFLNQLKMYVKGDPDVESRAMRYTRTYITDTLFTYSRTYQQAVTNDLGLRFYYYSGGVIDKTRSFCKDRVGNYYHRKEIEMWAQLDWPGKKQETTESSIFIFAGGWNCGHQIVPVSDAVVPGEVMDRAKSEGFI